MTAPASEQKLTKEQRRMREVVEKFQAYVATYDQQEFFDTYLDKTFLDDMLYGLGVALQTKTDCNYEFADGYERFKRRLRTHLQQGARRFGVLP